MLQRIVIRNFKSLREVDLHLGAMNLFIGTNASGKSNFFDALRVLQGIGNGFTLGEILDGKPRSATSEVWEGVRGGSAKACYAGAAAAASAAPPMEPGEVSLEAHGRLPGSDPGTGSPWVYQVAFDPLAGRITRESLSVGGTPIYEPATSGRSSELLLKVRYFKGNKGTQPHLAFEPARPVLTQFARRESGVKKAHAEAAAQVARALANVQRLDPAPQVLRGYSQAHQIGRMGEHGENFAALVRTLCADADAKDAYLAWLRLLRPAEVDDVGILAGAVGEPMFALIEGPHTYPAPALSDGTLRFAAIAAAFFQPDMPALMTLEEIENGIHAQRIRLLVELLRSQAESGQVQVMATTHSPIVLAWLRPEEYHHTFFCKRDEHGASIIQPLPEVPHFLEVVQRQPISDLFAEGWLEVAL